MKIILKRVVLAFTAVFMLVTDMPLLFVPIVPPPFEQLVPEAHAVLGVRRRTRRRTAVVVGSVASAQVAAANQQAAAAQQEAAAAQQQATQSGAAVPVGTVVPALPGGCTSVVVNNANYFNCSGVYYKAAFQGNNLVYAVVPQP
ncbi:MAG: hypothetical protein PVG51_07165 [Desulfosarcina sp.]|jgi:hypothetical protein